MNTINSLKPGVDKFYLILIASAMWSGVGVYLDCLAYGWLLTVNLGLAIIYLSSGILLALAIYHVMFKRFAAQNIARISELPDEKICLFAFQRWTSYPLVVVMISLGIFLRFYSPIPKPYLAILYIGIGTSLFLASLRYYRYLSQLLKHEEKS
jgi:hypothetical protein